MESMTRLVVGRVDQNMSVALYETFTKMEVKEAFFQIHLIKVPSLDGTLGLFYQQFWHIVDDVVSRLVLQVLNRGANPTEFNKTLFVLIPKVKRNPTCTSDFRPISLCNVIFKLITKIVLNWLKCILPNIVGDTQSTFVPNRIIIDNALVAF